MTVYIISVKVYSEKAARLGKYPYVWKGDPQHKGHIKYRGKLPIDEKSFQKWMMSLLRANGYPHGGTVKILRTQAKGESKGMKCIFIGYVDEDHVDVQRVTESVRWGSGTMHKAVPGMPWSRQPWYQREGFLLRPSGRFRGTGGWPPKPRQPDPRLRS